MANALPVIVSLRNAAPCHMHGCLMSYNGDSYWQEPDPGELAKKSAQRNKAGMFFELSMLFVLRSPDGLGTFGEPEKADGKIRVKADGTGGFTRNLVFSSTTGELVGIQQSGRVAQGATSSPAVRELQIVRHRNVGDLAIPVEWLDRYGGVEFKVVVSELLVNGPLSPADFRSPSTADDFRLLIRPQQR